LEVADDDETMMMMVVDQNNNNNLGIIHHYHLYQRLIYIGGNVASLVSNYSNPYPCNP
jgi:hypothetical protein